MLKEVKEENQQYSETEQDGGYGIVPPLLWSGSDAEFYDPPRFPQGNQPATEPGSGQLVQTDGRLLEAVPTAPLAFPSSSTCTGCSDLTAKLEAIECEKSQMVSNFSDLTTKLEAIECEKSQMASNFSSLLAKLEAIECEKCQMVSNVSDLTAKLEAIECEKSQMASNFSSLMAKLEAIECEKSQMVSNVSDLTAKLEAIECERNMLSRKVAWYEQVRDWVQSGGERLVCWMVEHGCAPPALVWGGELIQRQNAAV